MAEISGGLSCGWIVWLMIGHLTDAASYACKVREFEASERPFSPTLLVIANTVMCELGRRKSNMCWSVVLQTACPIPSSPVLARGLSFQAWTTQSAKDGRAKTVVESSHCTLPDQGSGKRVSIADRNSVATCAVYFWPRSLILRSGYAPRILRRKNFAQP